MANINVKDASGSTVAIPITPIGQTTGSSSVSVVLASDQGTVGSVFGKGVTVEVTPTVTANTYTAGYGVGGVMTFANILPASTFNGVLQSITLKFKASLQTGVFAVAIFTANPSNGTYTDRVAPTFNASDNPGLVGVYQLTTPLSVLGTQTIYNLDGIGKQIVGSSTSLYAVLISVTASAALASTTDVSLNLGVIQ